MVQPGKYTAKPCDWGIAAQTDREGNPIIEVHFNIEGQGTTKWSGFTNAKAIERTLESLLYMGFTSPNLETLADGVTGGALDKNTEVNITVDFQQKKGPNGTYVNDTKYTHVKWVNKVGGVKTMDAAQKTEAKTKLAGLNAMLAQKRAEFGVTTKKPTVEL